MWYDSREGISASLSSLEAFRKLLDERRIAGYQREEHLYTWYVFGYFYLDGCGNVGTAVKFDAQKKIENFPDVTTCHEFHGLIHEWQKTFQPDVLSQEELNAEDFSYSKNTRPYPISVLFSMKDTVPHTRIVCPFCKEAWKISNIKDVVERPSETTLPLGPFHDNLTVGKMLEFFKQQSYYAYTYDFLKCKKQI